MKSRKHRGKTGEGQDGQVLQWSAIDDGAKIVLVYPSPTLKHLLRLVEVVVMVRGKRPR